MPVKLCKQISAMFSKHSTLLEVTLLILVISLVNVSDGNHDIIIAKTEVIQGTVK